MAIDYNKLLTGAAVGGAGLLATSALAPSDKQIAAPLTNPGITSGLANFSPTGFNTPGFSGIFNDGTFNLERSPVFSQNLAGLTDTFQANADFLRSDILPKVAPGIGGLTSSRLAGLESSRRRAIGNLRDNLARRRVLGSSFGTDALARAEVEFQQEEDRIRAESFLQELELTTQITQQAFELEQKKFNTLVSQTNFEGELGARVSESATRADAASTAALSQILASLAKDQSAVLAGSAAGTGRFLGDIVTSILSSGITTAGTVAGGAGTAAAGTAAANVGTVGTGGLGTAASAAIPTGGALPGTPEFGAQTAIGLNPSPVTSTVSSAAGLGGPAVPPASFAAPGSSATLSGPGGGSIFGGTASSVTPSISLAAGLGGPAVPGAGFAAPGSSATFSGPAGGSIFGGTSAAPASSPGLLATAAPFAIGAAVVGGILGSLKKSSEKKAAWGKFQTQLSQLPNTTVGGATGKLIELAGTPVMTAPNFNVAYNPENGTFGDITTSSTFAPLKFSVGTTEAGTGEDRGSTRKVRPFLKGDISNAQRLAEAMGLDFTKTATYAQYQAAQKEVAAAQAYYDASFTRGSGRSKGDISQSRDPYAYTPELQARSARERRQDASRGR